MPKRWENDHFANGKPVLSPEAGISFLRLQNFQEWSLREREHGRFIFREEIFSSAETSEKIVISRTVSRPFRRRPEYVFSGSKTSKNVHFTNGNPAFLISGGNFSCAETPLEMDISRNLSCRFAGGQNTPSQTSNRPKMITPQTEPDCFVFREETFSCTETSFEMIISRAVIRPFRQRQNTLSQATKVKNNQIAKGNTAVSYFRRKIFM